jgi:hypothetical protein
MIVYELAGHGWHTCDDIPAYGWWKTAENLEWSEVGQNWVWTKSRWTCILLKRTWTQPRLSFCEEVTWFVSKMEPTYLQCLLASPAGINRRKDSDFVTGRGSTVRTAWARFPVPCSYWHCGLPTFLSRWVPWIFSGDRAV